MIQKKDLFQIQQKKGQLITVQIIELFIKFCLKNLIKLSELSENSVLIT